MIEFVLEPNILQRIEIGYDEILDPKALEPHMGIDEEWEKGDFFGPLVIASYTDEKIGSSFKRSRCSRLQAHQIRSKNNFFS